jgi:hypothetical protein
LETNAGRFIYGGYSDDATPPVSDEIYVLSLPGFVWKRVTPGSSTARYQHSCEVVGNRQLLSVGGSSAEVQDPIYGFADPDPNAQGLGIFDLTDLEWKDGYDANAALYESADEIQQWYQQAGPRSVHWASDELRALFPSDVLDKYNLNPSDESTSGGTIAGAVIGVLVFLALLGGLAWWFFRRRRAGSRDRQISGDWSKPELEGSPWHSSSPQPLLKSVDMDSPGPRHELGDNVLLAELGAGEGKYELAGSDAKLTPEKAHRRSDVRQQPPIQLQQIQLLRPIDIDSPTPSPTPSLQRPERTLTPEPTRPIQYHELP